MCRSTFQPILPHRWALSMYRSSLLASKLSRSLVSTSSVMTDGSLSSRYSNGDLRASDGGVPWRSWANFGLVRQETAFPPLPKHRELLTLEWFGKLATAQAQQVPVDTE